MFKVLGPPTLPVDESTQWLDSDEEACEASIIPEAMTTGALLLVDSIMPDRFCGESPD